MNTADTADMVTIRLAELTPPTGRTWQAADTPVTMTRAFHTAWIQLDETDQESAAIRIGAIIKPIWHPSLVVTTGHGQVMTTTTSTGALLFFTVNPDGSGYLFQALIPSGTPPTS